MKLFISAMLVGVAVCAAPVHAEEKAAAPAAEVTTTAISTTTTPIGDILDNPAAKAVVEKHLPGFSSHPQIDMARSFTLKAIQSFQPDMIKDDLLAAIDADFAALATPKAS